jgi:Ser/Thr protein kinase RdoA (MazF antagonist)
MPPPAPRTGPASLTAAKVASAFALPEPVGPLQEVPGREAHHTWRLDTIGARYFVKVYDRPWDMPAWSGWIRALQGSWEIESAAVAAGLPVARPVHPPGALWPWVDLGFGRDQFTVRVHEWVAGVQRTDPVPPPLAYSIGELLARIHRLLPPLRRWRRRPMWPGDWSTGVPLPRQAGDLSTKFLADALPLLEAASAFCARSLAEDAPLVRSHRDLHAHNMLVRRDGTPVIIDWDAASTQRADWELVETALEVAGYLTGPPDREVVAAVAAGYRAAGGPAWKITTASFAGVLICAQNWLQASLYDIAWNSPAVGSPAGGSLGTPVVVQALGAVEQVMMAADAWVSWFQ